MFGNVKGFWGAIGVSLALIAMYLVLEYAGGASTVVTAVGSSTSQIFKTLQAR